MVYRFSWVAALAAIGLAMARLERLLRSGTEGLPWEVVIVAAAVLGGAITWAAIAYRLDWRLAALINLLALVVTVVRIAVPDTTWFIFPTLDSFSELGVELGFARDVIRTGVAPVIPLSGVVAVLAAVFWAIGALVVFGLQTGRPYLAVLTPLVTYLQFATMDRRPGGWWLAAFLFMLGGGLLAVALDRRRQGTGVLTSPTTRLAVMRSVPSLAVVTLLTTVTVALVGTNALARFVPRSGYLEWRAQSGLTGDYYGSVSYNPFVGIHQGLVSQTNTPVFVADVGGEVAPDRLYWRLITLETFNGIQWFSEEPVMSRPGDNDTFEDPGQIFRGPTDEVTQDIVVLALQMDWIPAAYAPTDVTAPNRSVERGIRVKDDASLRFDALSYRGMNYSVVSQVPDPDLAVLGAGSDGELSPVFAGAADDGAYQPRDAVAVPDAMELGDPDRYLDLPEGIDPGVATLARAQTRGLTTDFERGLALETFFRTPAQFRYSTDIEPGLRADDVGAWLIDPESPSYRTGYCEQFATAMAVMARELGIPSRVVLGFTPGTLLEDGRVVVRDRNAHAWVELWMPTQGWVRFDPTPRGDRANPATTADLPFDIDAYLDIPEPERQSFPDFDGGPILPFIDEDPFDIPQFVGTGGDELITDRTFPAWVLLAGLGFLALFGSVPGIKWIRRRLRMRRLAKGDISAAWREITDRLTDLGEAPEAAATPLEYAAGTDDAMIPLADVYGRQLYGPDTGPPASVALAGRSLSETEGHLTSRYSLPRRITARYRLRSLTPRWWRRLRGDRPG
jgi:transglutaminase-like putative cysteine protease